MSVTATPIGTSDVTAIARRYIVPEIADAIYLSNAMFTRLCAMGKKEISGGFQIEVPLMYADIQAGGSYSGYDVLNVSPSQTIQNMAFPWSQYYVSIAVDGLTLVRADSPAPIATYVKTKFAQARMSMENRLGTGVWSNSANPNDIVGLVSAIDDGTNTTIYGGLSRTTYPFLKCQIDSSSTSLTLANMQSLFSASTFGGRSPSIAFATSPQYNAYWNLVAGQAGGQRFPVQPGGSDEQLAQAGFKNILFNGVPVLTDSHVPTVTAQGKFFFINEDYLTLYVNDKVDMYLEDFQTPINQDAMVAKMLWYGQLIDSNPQTSGKFTALTG